MTRYLRLTKTEHAALHRDLLAQKPHAEIAQTHGVAATTVRYHATQCAASEALFEPNMTPGPNLSRASHHWLHWALEQGRDLDETARLWGLSLREVEYHRDQHCDYGLPEVGPVKTTAPGFVTRTTPPKKQEELPMKTTQETPQEITNDMIRARIRAGDSLRTIAEDWQISYGRVHGINAQMGKANKKAQQDAMEAMMNAGRVNRTEPIAEVAEPVVADSTPSDTLLSPEDAEMAQTILTAGDPIDAAIGVLAAKKDSLREAYTIDQIHREDRLRRNLDILDEAIAVLRSEGL